jgi:hypothetical protein
MINEDEKFDCPACGAMIGPYAANCYNCGCELEWEDEEQVEDF